HSPLNEHQRFFVIQKNSWIQKFSAPAKHLISGGTSVFLRLKVEWRKLGCSHIKDQRVRQKFRSCHCATVSNGMTSAIFLFPIPSGLVGVSPVSRRITRFFRSRTAIFGR